MCSILQLYLTNGRLATAAMSFEGFQFHETGGIIGSKVALRTEEPHRRNQALTAKTLEPLPRIS